MLNAQSAYDGAVAAAESAFNVSTGPISQAHVAAVASLLAAYQANLQSSQTQYQTDMQGPNAARTTVVAGADAAYNIAVAGFQLTQNATMSGANAAFTASEQAAATDYWSAQSAYYMSFMSSMTGMTPGNPSILYNAARQYAIDVAFASVAVASASGTAGVAFVTSERAADTTRDIAVNTADNTLAVAGAGASKAQALRDVDSKEAYLHALASENATYIITITGYRALAEIAKAGAKLTFDTASNDAAAAQSRAIAAASQVRTVAMINAGAAFANDEVDACHTQSDTIADADEALTNSLAQAEGTYAIAAAGAGTVLAKAISSADQALINGIVGQQVLYVSTLMNAVVSWTASTSTAISGAANSGGSATAATLSVATAWQQYTNLAATAAAVAANVGMSTWAAYANATAAVGKAAADAQADASEAFTLSAVNQFLTATAADAAASTSASKAISADLATAGHTAVAANQALAITQANAAKTNADASIDAAQTAANGLAGYVYAYTVASIGVGLIATTASTGFALLRENSGITAVSGSQRSVINAGYTKTIADLAADLAGRNANEALDDPIAIAAAQQIATEGVRAAWQNVNNLQARAAETFAGMAPGGGAGMFIVGFMGGVNDAFDITWASVIGVGHGAAMIANAVTLHQIDGLDSYVDGLIEQNGGSGSLYWYADWSANIGVGAAALAGGIYAAGIISAWEAAITLPTIGWNVIMTGGGTLTAVFGVTGTTTITITGAELFVGGITIVYMAGRNPASEKRALDFARRIEQDLGKEGRRIFHDLKQPGMGDRTIQELIRDAIDVYKQAGRVIPQWLQRLSQ